MGQETQKEETENKSFCLFDISGRKNSLLKWQRSLLPAGMCSQWGKGQWCGEGGEACRQQVQNPVVWSEGELYIQKKRDGDERRITTRFLTQIIESKDVMGQSRHPSSILSLYRWRSKLRGVKWLGQGDIANEWWSWDQSPGLLITLSVLLHHTMLILCICANEYIKMLWN